MSNQLVVEDHPHLVRDSYSKAITNRDTQAYDNYMSAALKRKERNSQLEKQQQEINIIKEEMSEIKGMLGQIIDKINGN
tara:strand:- start:538 stop:774 length:237 start_codon:yes stop_codon:yes gene_type:complete